MLPGKLCIGILEEDNPLKSYFRLKPLLVENEGRYEYFDGTQLYPEEGCIRIVPDKNESSHFKARMRRMGRYCLLDLREHAGENDKIRPNKNYHGDEGEKNAHIVYSDVVREPAADMIFEFASFDEESGACLGEVPGTPRVLAEGSLDTWRFIPGEEGDLPRVERDGDTLCEEELQRFELPGFSGETLHLAIRLPGTEPATVEPAPAKPDKASQPEKNVPAPSPAEEEKPWLCHGDIPAQPPIDHRLSLMQQTLAAQSGLTPRRSRSLQEIIEEKWRHSRVDQLGHPVPAHAMGQPVENPIERALEALRSAWSIPEIHEELLSTLSNTKLFSAEIEAYCQSRAADARQRELEDMEAERLRALAALDKLRRDKQALREAFKQEIREEEAAAFEDIVARTNAAREELRAYETRAEEARMDAEMARDAFAALSDGRFEEKLRDFALTSHAVELLQHPAPAAQVGQSIPTELVRLTERGQWLERLRHAFAGEGLSIGDVDGLNLLVCLALGEDIIFSGCAASDKLPAARALTRTLGNWREATANTVNDERKDESDGAQLTLIPDANATPDAAICRGSLHGDGRLLSVVSDAGAGHALSPEALERAFLVRMEPPAADAPWKPAHRDDRELSPALLSDLQAAFDPGDMELPAALERRLQGLRMALAAYDVRLSRHTLDLMWRYCTAMLATGKLSPAEALDRAFAQKALPCILAEAPVRCLVELKRLLAEMPHSLRLLDAPLPIMI